MRSFVRILIILREDFLQQLIFIQNAIKSVLNLYNRYLCYICMLQKKRRKNLIIFIKTLANAFLKKYFNVNVFNLIYLIKLINYRSKL